jgi:hypothetical protein
MKLRTLFFVVPFLLAVSSLAAAGELVQTVAFSQKDLIIQKAGIYHQIELKGLPSAGRVGAPLLPKLVQAVSLPAGAAITGVELISEDVIELNGVFDVMPAQKAVPLPMPGKSFKTEPPSPDPKIYGRDALYPASLLLARSTGSLCGYRIGQVEINPVRYNPATKKLYLSQSITYRIRYQEGKAGMTIPTRDQQGLFGRQAKMLVANPADVERFAPQVSRKPSKTLPAGDYRSVIISGLASFDTVFARLAAWHTQKGYRDTVIDVSSIYSGYPGLDEPEKIRNFIIEAKNTWGTVFVLLAGQNDDLNAGQDLVPSRHAYYMESGAGYYGDEDMIPSDFYYSDLDGTWDANGNQVWGEIGDEVDMYSDVFVGRAPVLDVAGAQNFVAKTLNYEKSNPGAYIKKMLLPAAILWSDYEERPVQRAIAGMTPGGWADDSLFERNGTLSQAAMVASMNSGRGLGHWIGHGDENGIYMGGAYYTSGNADASTNGSKLGVHISIACFTGAVDEVSGGDCMAEHISNRVGGGAVGVMMNSRYGWGYPPSMGPNDCIDTAFFYSLFKQGIYQQGMALAQSKNAFVPTAIVEVDSGCYRWCIYELNLFGDPALPILTNDPIALTVSHPATVQVGYNDFAVTVTDPAKAAVPGALVCLMTESKDCYIYDTTDASGQVTLHPSPITSGQTLSVTVTAWNHQPYEGSAEVSPASVPYVIHLKHTISDAAGNNDGVANPGENLRLPLWVINHGVTADGVVATLRAVSPNGSVTADSSYAFGIIAAGDSALYGPGFGVLVNPGDSNGVSIPLTLECRDGNDSSWTSSFPVTVGTAVLSYNSRSIGGNGRLDPSENAAMTVGLRNNGLGYGYNVQGILRCGDPRITVTDSTIGYGTLDPGATGAGGADSFAMTVGSMPAGTVVAFTLVMKADGVSDKNYLWNEAVGDIRYQPTPDNAAGAPLYYAVEDSDGAGRAPIYQWTEIRTMGTQVALTDESVSTITLPFTFRWYGTGYTSLSVCSNGWISFGSNGSTEYDNTAIPTSAFSNPTIFPCWNDLNPSSRWVGYYNDAANHRFIVEYDSIVYYGTTTYNKFQVIYYDSTVSDPYYDVLLQYSLYTDGMGTYSSYYPSIGFQQNSTTGCQLLFNHAYSSTALPMSSHRAIRITRHAEPLGVEGQSDAASVLPQVYHLGTAHPNPAPGRVSISYQLPCNTEVELAVYNISGQKVRILDSGVRPAGYHTVTWDVRDDAGRKVSAGVYLYRINAGSYSATHKLVVIK